MKTSFDTKERTAARAEQNAKTLESIKLFTLTEIEPIIGVTHRTLLTYIKDGRIKAIKVGGKWKVSEENLKKFINGES